MKKYPWNSIFTDISPYYSWNQKTLEDNPSSSIFPYSCIFVVTLNIFFFGTYNNAEMPSKIESL